MSVSMICPSDKPLTVATTVFVLFNIKANYKKIFLVATIVAILALSRRVHVFHI